MGNSASREADDNVSSTGSSRRGWSKRIRRRKNATSRKGSDVREDSQNEELCECEDESRKSKSGYFSMITNGYNELVNAVIRPPRAHYDMTMLGPAAFSVGGRQYVRNDIELMNGRNQKLMCSHWRPVDDTQSRPCMVYLHGNASCRVEALECLPVVLSTGMSLFSFDFAGSGMSDGDYISLGWFEKFDVETVIEYLRTDASVSTIGLWGRSMGASTALMYASGDPVIACMILDSPFASLKQLAKELCDTAQIAAPRFAVGLAMKMVRASVKSRGGFDMNKLNPIEHAPSSFIPALFGAAQDDQFIRSHHAQTIHDAYAGDKNIVIFDGDHGSARPAFFSTSVRVWLQNTMLTPFANDPQPLNLFDAFHAEYTMPQPVSPSVCGPGALNGISENLSRLAQDSFQADLDFDDFENDDYYEQAMLNHVLQLSLAESQAQGAVSEGEIKIDQKTHDDMENRAVAPG